MDGIFGIGIPEILIVIVLALIILGPKDMVETARKLGRWVYRVYHSPTWRMIMSTSQELRELPTRFVREAGLEDTMAAVKNTTADVRAQLKEVASGMSTELKDVAREASGELKEGRQELGDSARAAVLELDESLPPAAPEAASLPEPPLEPPAEASLVDPGGTGTAPAGVQPQPFSPDRAGPEALPASDSEEFTI